MTTDEMAEWDAYLERTTRIEVLIDMGLDLPEVSETVVPPAHPHIESVPRHSAACERGGRCPACEVITEAEHNRTEH